MSLSENLSSLTSLSTRSMEPLEVEAASPGQDQDPSSAGIQSSSPRFPGRSPGQGEPSPAASSGRARAHRTRGRRHRGNVKSSSLDATPSFTSASGLQNFSASSELPEFLNPRTREPSPGSQSPLPPITETTPIPTSDASAQVGGLFSSDQAIKLLTD